MKTDPRAACRNPKECLLWALLHDAIAHPLMAVTNYSELSLLFHDYTSHKAWPRVTRAYSVTMPFHSKAWGKLYVKHIGEDAYSISHPSVSHTLVTTAQDYTEAAEKAEKWFDLLSQEFQGKFSQLERA